MRGKIIAVLALCGSVFIQPPSSQADNNDVPYLRVTQKAFSVDIPEREFTSSVGQRLPLFQKNQRYLIALVEDSLEGPQLCAFPRLDKSGRPTAWITREQEIVFGASTRSCRGLFYLSPSEALPVLEDNPLDYVVNVRRNDHQINLALSKPVKGLALEYRPPPSFAKATVVRLPVDDNTERESPAAILTDPPLPDPGQLLPNVEARSIKGRPRTARATEDELALPGTPEGGVSSDVTISFLLPEPVVQEENRSAGISAGSTLASAESQPHSGTAASDQPAFSAAGDPLATGGASIGAGIEPARLAKTFPISRPPSKFEYVIGFMSDFDLVFRFMLLSLISYAGYYSWARRKVLATIAQNGRDPALKARPSVPVFPTSGIIRHVHPDGTFSGSLPGFSMTELIQFLNSARETGLLKIHEPDGMLTHELFFHEGEILNGIFWDKQGEPAVRDILRCDQGTFSFVRRDTSSQERLVPRSTMSLLLDANKVMDEEKCIPSPATPPTPPPAPPLTPPPTEPRRVISLRRLSTQPSAVE